MVVCNGNIGVIPKTSDPISTLSGTYDAWNRLVKLVDDTDTAAEYEYDARNYRIVTKSYVDNALDETRHTYYTNGWQAIEERINSESTPDRQWVWGLRYIDDLILRDRTTTDPLDERLYALQDANWNVTAVVDDGGTVQERYEYDPYGITTVLSSAFSPQSPAFEWETTYCGYRWEDAVGLFAVRYRWYSPRLASWVSRDPIGYAAGVNLYEYVNSDPEAGGDPWGLIGDAFHHPYSLYLGGSMGQPVIYLTAAEHQAAHAYFVNAGFPYGDPGRAAWEKLTAAQQKEHVMGSLRAAGVSEKRITKNINKIMKNANPGTRTPRVGKIGKAFSIAAMATTTMATAGYDNYVQAGEELGIKTATKIGLCSTIQNLWGAQGAESVGAGQKQPTIMRFSLKGVVYTARVVPHNGNCQIEVTHVEEKLSLFLLGYYPEIIEDVPLGSCPLDDRQVSCNCSTVR